jgi:hypothetical protein
MARRYWWSIEVFDANGAPASAWRRAYGNALVEALITNGAVEWEWHEHSWGVLLEIAFTDEARWPAFRELPVVRAALDAAPDPVNGVLAYPGRGGSSGRVWPRRPRPIRSAGAAPIPTGEPQYVRLVDLSA